MSAVAPQRRATWHDAFDAQMALWRWTRPGQRGQEWLNEHLAMQRDGLPENTFEMVAQLYGAEPGKLLAADPFYVSGEMCDVIEAARHEFAPEPLLPTDLLSPFGFVYFERSFLLKDRFDVDTYIQAFSWCPIISTPKPGEDLWQDRSDLLARLQQRDYISAWKEREERLADSPVIEEHDEVDGLALTIYCTRQTIPGYEAQAEWERSLGAPSLLPMHLTPWWFGMSFGGNDVDAYGVQTGAAWWWRLVQTTLRLMQQRIAVRHHSRPDRASRREAQKRGFDEREVVVVRLRREKSDQHGEPESEANYSHRFIVGGHWRNQWYPSGQVHRQIYISPYVKGPEHLPLVVKPRRVFNFTR